ncbi:MAG: hypothetical protein GX221_06675 [Candidatus Riflebacteria bacterium]|nr:hypothetical protein [Candidatus Riflebacteria bacterium]
MKSTRIKSVSSKQSAYTLMEALIAVAIASIISLTIFAALRTSLANVALGQKKLRTTEKIQAITKSIFFDLKRTGLLAHGFNISGETRGKFTPHNVLLLKFPEEPSDNLQMINTSPGQGKGTTTVYLLIDEPNSQLSSLVRISKSGPIIRRITKVANAIKDFRVHADPYNKNKVRITMTVYDSLEPTRSEKLDFSVHLDSDLVRAKQYILVKG